MGLHDLYTDSQLDNLKRVAFAFAGAGVGLPLLTRLLNFKSPIDFGSNVESTNIGIPVVDTGMLSDSNKAPSRKPGKTERFEPSSDLLVRKKSKGGSEKKAISLFGLGELGDFTNPYYLPGVVAAAAIPFMGSSYLAKRLLDDKSVQKEEINEAKNNLAKQMMQNQIASKMPTYDDYEIVGPTEDKLKDLYENTKEKSQQIASKAKESGKGLLNKLLGKKDTKPAAQPEVKLAEASDFISNLDKLANIYIEKKGAWQNTFIDAWDAVGKYFTDYYGHPVDAAKALYNKTVDVAKDVAGGYAGTLAGLGLAGLGAGTYYGYKDRSKNDPEELLSRYYYNQFLQRQQEQGMPIQAYPTPIKFK